MQLSECCTFVLYTLCSVLLGDNVSNYVFVTDTICEGGFLLSTKFNEGSNIVCQISSKILLSINDVDVHV